MEKIPNWLRYILAIPYGIVINILVYWAYYYSNLFFSHPESMYMLLIDYLYVNCVQIFVFFTCMCQMLPKHQFKFTITISILYCSVCIFALGFAFATQTLEYNWTDWLAVIISITSFVYSCYYINNEYPSVKKVSVDEPFKKYLKTDDELTEEELKEKKDWDAYCDKIEKEIEEENAKKNWQTYLETNFKTEGTRTYSKDIRFKKSNNFCTNCGEEIEGDFNFCKYCGNKLK